MLSLDNEAELSALLGHESGHVNARHTAEQMSKAMLTQAVYSPDGMIGLMVMFRGLSKHKPSTIELMFATHPMSQERYRTAVERAQTEYRTAKKLPLDRERYMDNTARLSSLKGAIEEMQKGERLMIPKKYDNAETQFRKALKLAPRDYTGLVMMSTCQLLKKRYRRGIKFAEKAQQVYPQEAQAYHLCGFAKIQFKEFEGAYQEFDTYEKLLPGNPNTIFFKGCAQEGMKHIQDAANDYHRYLKLVQDGNKAKCAYQRLRQWGYYR